MYGVRRREEQALQPESSPASSSRGPVVEATTASALVAPLRAGDGLVDRGSDWVAAVAAVEVGAAACRTCPGILSLTRQSHLAALLDRVRGRRPRRFGWGLTPVVARLWRLRLSRRWGRGRLRLSRRRGRGRLRLSRRRGRGRLRGAGHGRDHTRSQPPTTRVQPRVHTADRHGRRAVRARAI
jgi:hypothetical protein